MLLATNPAFFEGGAAGPSEDRLASRSGHGLGFRPKGGSEPKMRTDRRVEKSRRISLVLMAVVVLSSACKRGERVSPGASPAPQVPVESAGPASPEVEAAVQGVLDSGRHPWLTWPDVASVLPDLKVLYAAEPDRLFWFGGDFAYPALPQVLETLTGCDTMGLRPADYDGVALTQRWAAMKVSASPSLTERALLDLAVTVSSMRLLQSAHRGRVDPRTVGFDYDVTSKRIDLATALRAARDGKGLTAAVAAAEPQFPVYHRLVKALGEYRTLASNEPPSLPALSKGQRKVEPGKPWVGVAALDARLRHFGDLPADAPHPSTNAEGAPLYAGGLVDAVKRFQGRHALEADGVIGSGTIEAMNVPVAHRVRQLELALERERWLPEMLKEPLIFVNVPLFRLWAYDPDRPDEPVKMNVVTGKALGHATPIFIDEMEYVTFRPYWNPPISIIRSELVPKARRDPSYFERENLEIVASGDENAPELSASPENLDQVAAGRLYLRQKPGDKNSLGLAVFIFPNTDNIYMHGTPAQSLFSRARRDFSHGCIRLEDPARLAQWVLRNDKAWTPERIDEAMHGSRPTRVNLKPKLKVILFYDTAYVNSKGIVQFADDLYGHDEKLEKALAGGYPYSRQG